MSAGTPNAASLAPPVWRPALAEAVGTFALVFAGTGAAVVDEVTGGTVTHVGVALAFWLVVMAATYAVGDVSGAHLNPAVTFGALRRLAGRLAIPALVTGDLTALRVYVVAALGGEPGAMLVVGGIRHGPHTVGERGAVVVRQYRGGSASLRDGLSHAR